MASQDEIINFTEKYLREFRVSIQEWQRNRGRVDPVLAVRLRDALTVMAYYFSTKVPDRLPTPGDFEDIPVILWERAIWDAAARGCEDLEGSICPELPSDLCQFWIPSELTEFSEARKTEAQGDYLLGQHLHFTPSEEFLWSRVWATELGNDPDDAANHPTLIRARPGEPLNRADCEAISRILFLQLEFVGLEETPLPRVFRRRYEREHKPLPVVRTVALRRAQRQQSDEATESGRNYSHQWLVRGHWRKQWYATKQQHSPKYIAPFVKGPADKPLKESRPTVFVAKR